MPIRPEFKADLERALKGATTGKQYRIYDTFAKYGWEISAEEVSLAATLAGFKSGWVYHNTGPRLQEKQAEYEKERGARKAYENAFRSRMEKQAQSDLEYQRRQKLEEAQRRAQQQFAEGFAWEKLFGAYWGPQAAPGARVAGELQRMGLKWPFTLLELRTAFKARAKKVHPDVGGTDEDFKTLIRDYDVLELHITKENT